LQKADKANQSADHLKPLSGSFYNGKGLFLIWNKLIEHIVEEYQLTFCGHSRHKCAIPENIPMKPGSMAPAGL